MTAICLPGAVSLEPPKRGSKLLSWKSLGSPLQKSISSVCPGRWENTELKESQSPKGDNCLTAEEIGRQNPGQKVKETGICSPKCNNTDKHWKTILHGAPTILHVLQAVYRLFFIPDHLFKNVCIANRPGRYRVSVQNKGPACLLPIIKDLGSLGSAFLSYSGTPCVYQCHLTIFIPTLWESGFREPTKIC